MKTLLVTGGAGFIGTNLIEKLLKNGHRIVCLDNLTLGSRENIHPFLSDSNFHFYEADISRVQTLLDAISGYNIDCIFHLAANSDIQASAEDPEIDFKNTFSTSYAVLECMRRKNIKKMFFASTSAIYGEQLHIKLSETSGSLLPISYYGGAKLASEAFISSYGV
jgi:UDP-glucose 4-epimerase